MTFFHWVVIIRRNKGVFFRGENAHFYIPENFSGDFTNGLSKLFCRKLGSYPRQACKQEQNKHVRSIKHTNMSDNSQEGIL